jgi:two-component system, cell cycle response regulator
VKVLVADDDPASCLALTAALRQWGYEVSVTASGQEAWEALHETQAPQLAILDWMMPDLEGPELCRRLRSEDRPTYTYLILLSARDAQDDVITGMDAGADDYVTKPFDPMELRLRVRAGKRIVNLQADLLRAQDELEMQSTHDALTGLWNRPAILRSLHAELARAEREALPLSVVMVDLDHFKAVNDTYGHQAGDTVLREVTTRMGEVIRPYDSLGRYGGEEFLLVLSGCDLRDTEALAERVRAHVCQTPVVVDAGPVTVTLSLGVAQWQMGRGMTAEDLIRAADDALYAAKHRGRNQVVAAGQPLEPSKA